MKKQWMAVLALVFPVFPAWADDNLASNQVWIEQVDGGYIFPVSRNISKVFDRGVGGDIVVGYRFDQHFSLSTSVGFYDCDQVGPNGGAAAGEWLYVPLLETARYSFGHGWVRPYLFLGVGLAFNSYSQTLPINGRDVKVSRQETDLLMAPGLGLLFIVSNGIALFTQARLDMNFTSNEALNSPAADNPSIFIPIQGGVSFFVL